MQEIFLFGFTQTKKKQKRQKRFCFFVQIIDTAFVKLRHCHFDVVLAVTAYRSIDNLQCIRIILEAEDQCNDTRVVGHIKTNCYFVARIALCSSGRNGECTRFRGASRLFSCGTNCNVTVYKCYRYAFCIPVCKVIFTGCQSIVAVRSIILDLEGNVQEIAVADNVAL